jgi:hypothetical protein
VSIETVHLHLSKASKVPTIALVTDKPEMWHGTAYQDRFLVHCRYQDYQMRKGEIISALKKVSTGTQPIQLYPLPCPGYNPSIIKHEKSDLIVYRYHPDLGSWRTQLALLKDGITSNIEPPKEFREYSIEDGRLFYFQNDLHISYTVSATFNNQHRCVVQYGRLEKRETHWEITNWHQPKYGKNDFSAMEKNFVLFEYEEN